MKQFDSIIDNLAKVYKDPKTEYSPTAMFSSSNDLSFAISRLKDARKTLSKESIAYKNFSTKLWTTWINLRDKTPTETASNLAFCIIKNTPLSNSLEEMKEVEDLFYKTMYDYTKSKPLAKVFTEFFFNNLETKMPDTRDWE